MDNGQVYVYVAPQANLNLIYTYYTVLPFYIDGLSNRADSLLQYIMYLARQNTDKIAKNGFFNISLRAVRNQLGLPDERGLRDQARLIRYPIEEAIEEIESKEVNFGNIKITPQPAPGIDIDTCSVAEWLDGNLKIEIGGMYADFFKLIDSNRNKKIKNNIQLQKRAKLNAMTAIEKKKNNSSGKQKKNNRTL